MNIPDLLARLDAEGLTVSLKVRLEGDTEPTPEQRELVQAHREELIAHLAGGKGLQLYGPLLLNLLRWIDSRYELRLEHPQGLALNATPEIALRLLNESEWCALFTPERDLLMSVGDVPASCIKENRLKELN